MRKALNTRSRKYQLTINNPIEKGYDHEKIRNILDSSKPKYYCYCDEIGKDGILHTHIYVYYENAVFFSTMKNRFPEAHIETAYGSSQENRDYIRKEGKYLDSEKKKTNHSETFKEYGEIPLDKATKNEKISDIVLEMIRDGATNLEIITEYPSYGTKIPHLDRMRQTILEEQYKKIFRKVKVHYIYGKTGTGKTRSVMETYGYENVYHVTNYEHPFDNYSGEKVLLLDEFRDSLLIKALLQYIDGYPCRLPARYDDKIACFTEVYIVSNIDLLQQYRYIQVNEPETWNALIRRITDVTMFMRNENGGVDKISLIKNNYYLKGGDDIV